MGTETPKPECVWIRLTPNGTYQVFCGAALVVDHLDAPSILPYLASILRVPYHDVPKPGEKGANDGN